MIKISQGEVGDGSNLFQIDTMNITDNCDPTIEHCGKCADFLTAYKNGERQNFSHCTQKIDDTSTYLCFCYQHMISNQESRGYVIPTFVTNEGFSEFGTQKIEHCERITDMVLEGYNFHLVIGDGGIGKSLFLSSLFTSFVVQSLDSENMSVIPFLLDGGYYGHDNKTPEEWFWHQLKKRFENFDCKSVIGNQKNKIYVFIDAINSIQYTDSINFEKKLKAWASFIAEFCEQYPNVTFLLSSRDIPALTNFGSQKQRKIYINPLEEAKILDFIALFVSSASEKERLKEIVSKFIDLPFIGIPYFLRKLIESPGNSLEIKNKTDIILLYIGSLFADISINIGLVSSTKAGKKFGNIDVLDLNIQGCSFFEIIFRCAFCCQEQNKKVLTLGDIESQFPGIEARYVIAVALEVKLLLQGGKTYTFSHPILQEFFAAMQIYSGLEREYSINSIIVFSDKTMNMEVLPHLYNLVSNKDMFISLLVDHGCLAYAAECVIDNDGMHMRKVATGIVDKIGNDTILLPEKMELGFYLGRIGDVRFCVRAEYIEPLITTTSPLCGIKASVYPVTNAEYAFFIRDGGYENMDYWGQAIKDGWFNYELVLDNIYNFWHDVRKRYYEDKDLLVNFCKNVSIDKDQCACLAYFLNMSDKEVHDMLRELYAKDKHKQPLLWDNPNYNNPSQPVVGISYYEAMAYCSWISTKMHKHYRLLSLEEWKAVATNGKQYAFGNNFDTKYCNTQETGISMILPVGIINSMRNPQAMPVVRSLVPPVP
jgi:hypothetical protein